MLSLFFRNIILFGFFLLMNQFIYAQSDVEIDSLDSISIPSKKNISIPEFKLIKLDTLKLGEFDEVVSGSYCAMGIPYVYDALHSFNYRRVDRFGGYINGKVNTALENIRKKGFKSDVKQLYIQIDPQTLTVYWFAVVGPSADDKCYVRIDSRGSAGGGLAAMEKQLPSMHALYPSLTSVKLLEFNENVIKCFDWNGNPLNSICSSINICQHFYKYYDSQVDVTVSLEEYTLKNPCSNASEVVYVPAIKKAKPKSKPQQIKYKVKSGDSLSEIAEKYHTSVSQIKKANGLRSDTLQIGKVLKIPK
jgi:LysM repeat protein